MQNCFALVLLGTQQAKRNAMRGRVTIMVHAYDQIECVSQKSYAMPRRKENYEILERNNHFFDYYHFYVWMPGKSR